tara:strand:- start:584 stop:766 length:183 start_codon:yes stop_codon:yes gene_type:complete
MFKTKKLLPGLDWGIQDHLLEELDRLYPNRCPHIDEDDREIWFKAGQASVVWKLKQMQKE